MAINFQSIITAGLFYKVVLQAEAVLQAVAINTKYKVIFHSKRTAEIETKGKNQKNTSQYLMKYVKCKVTLHSPKNLHNIYENKGQERKVSMRQRMRT